jgi:hypothetical protein
MFDYLKIEKPFCEGKYKPLFDKLKKIATYENGTQRFEISNGFQPLQVFVNENTKNFIIDGSLPYYLQGHNFSFSNQAFYNTIELLESRIGISLLDAEVQKFEFGKILEVERPPKEIFSKHGNLAGYRKTTYTDGIEFTDRISRTKLYDAGKRLKTTSAKNIISTIKADFGFNPKANYLKLETHYLKPQVKFKEVVTVERLFSSDFQKISQDDLLNTYQKIEKMKQSKIPTDKKLLNSGTIPLLYLQEISEQYGFDAEKGLLEYLRTIPIFDKDDRKNRKRQILENQKKINTSQVQILDYDLTPKLKLI